MLKPGSFKLIAKAGNFATGMAATFCLLMASPAFADGSEKPIGKEAFVEKSGAQIVKVKVLTDKYSPPFSLLDTDGSVKGFEVDLLNEIGKIARLKMEFSTQPWNTVLKTAKTGKFDIIGGAITITKERMKDFNVSNPYFISKQTIMTFGGPAISNPKELMQKVKIGVLKNTVTENEVKKMVPGDMIVPRDLMLDVVKDLANKKTGAVVAGSGEVIYYVERYKELLPQIAVLDDLPKEYYGFYFPKNGDPELLQKVNGALRTLQDNGTYNQLYNKWFNSVPNKLPVLRQVREEII